MLLLHGVLRSEDAGLALPDGARLVAEGPVAALVTAAPAGELTGDDAVAHLDLLVAVVTEVPVLPVPLGTGAPDGDAVRREVLADAAGLRAQLDAVADLVELRLDIAFDTDATVAEIARADPQVHRLAERGRAPGAGLPERLAVGEAVAGRVAEQHTARAGEWTAELDALAERSVVLHADESLRRAAYLVRRGRVADADAAVVRLRDAVGTRARLEYVGPLPVYSFLDVLDDATPREPASRWGW